MGLRTSRGHDMMKEKARIEDTAKPMSASVDVTSPWNMRFLRRDIQVLGR